MSEDRDRRLAGAAARARAAMTTGATLHDVLRTFRTDEQLGVIEAVMALRELAPMNLTCAKMLVSNPFEGRSYAHLTLSDLELLGDTPRVGGIDYFMRCQRDEAIIKRKPYLLYVRERRTTQSVRTYVSATPLDTEPMHPAPDETGPFRAIALHSSAFATMREGRPPHGRTSCVSCVTSPIRCCCTSFARPRRRVKSARGHHGYGGKFDCISDWDAFDNAFEIDYTRDAVATCECMNDCQLCRRQLLERSNVTTSSPS